MSVITFSCTSCGQVLQVGIDKAGRKAKCVQCGLVLTIPASAGGEVIAESASPSGDLSPGARPSEAPPRRRPRDDDDYDDRDDDRPRRRRDEDLDVARPKASSWDKVQLGFLISFIGLCVMAGAYGVMLMGYLLGTFRLFDVAVIFVRIGAPFIFLGTIGALVGHVFWIFVSNRKNAKGFAIAAIAVAGGYLVVQIVFLAQVFAGFGAHPVVHMLVAIVLSAHFIMIAFYLRALGQMFEDSALERQAMLIIILAGAYCGYVLLITIIAMAVYGSFGGGTAAFVIMELLQWIGRALLVVTYTFTILAIYRGKTRVDRA